MKTIVYLTRNKIEVYSVVGSGVEKLGETGYVAAEFSKLLGQLKQQLGLKTVRVLVEDSLSYVVTIRVPEKEFKNERQFIATEIAKKIPEKLEDYDWDYVNVHYKADEKGKTKGQMVLVFAPVKHIWESLAQAAKTVGLKIEAVEPVIWAKNRDNNPVIGLTKKKDIKGEDSKVLNLDFEKVKQESGIRNQESGDKKEEVKLRKGYIYALLGVFLVSILTIGGILVQRRALNRNQESGIMNQETEIEEVASESADPSEPDEEEEVDLTEYKLSVENGSGVGGEAAYVAQILEAEGFEKIETKNADRSNYDLTTVKLKELAEGAVYEVIERSLNSEYEVTRSAQLLTEDENYDVVIVVGKRI